MKFCAIAMCASAAWGQLQTNSIVVTASRTLNAIPDQAVFSVTVYSGYGTSLNEVVDAVSSVGITSSNFVTFGYPFSVLPANYSVEWDFNLTVPLSSLSGTIASLSALQSKGSNGLAISFSLQGTNASPAAQPACVIADLVADATGQAQQLADAANLRLGPILAVSDQAVAGILVFLVAGIPFFTSSTPPLACVATVKFGIVRL